MNDKMRITIEIPNTGLEENILRKGEWEDDSLFGRSLRNALIHFSKESFCLNCMLDKIRAEIEQLPTTSCTETHSVYIYVDDFKENVLTIFDKYKVESEE